ncbi:MAG: PQQ-binding-like beta-propeller repeat protein [Anaerolineae bacterium]|nr:PQQ-binding-like beta-propeller repeat protein [Anaerolineae bacterium]
MSRSGTIRWTSRRGLSLAVVLVSLFTSGTIAHPLTPMALQGDDLSAETNSGAALTIFDYDNGDVDRFGGIEGTSVEDGWPMVGANPQRTSWTPEEVRGKLQPVWYRVIEPYIAPYIQIIAANGLLYISTASGLYALDAATGETAWIYPTELPLGNAPTFFDGVVYVGGYDHKLYALEATSGQLKWTFAADAGFATNPLVLDIDGRTIVYAGNRDGILYAIEDLGAASGLLWQYQTDGPILFSAAHAEGIVYIASDDSYAYALDARSGALVWQSSKLPGAGFHAGWPVIYQDQDTGADVVILAGSNNYRHFLRPAYGYDLQGREIDDIWPDRFTELRGTLFGARLPDGTVDATRVLQYFEAKPWRRTYIILDRQTGHEVTFDFDGDGNPEYAPVLWHGTHSGNRYPPVVGADGILYQSNTYMSDEWIPGGHVSGWAFGSGAISTPSSGWKAMDEPLAYAAGGNLIYWNHCNGRSAGAIDVVDASAWLYFNYDLEEKLPGYNVLYESVHPDDYTRNSLFQGTEASPNGVYGQHGYQNPPIPYDGMVYMHRSNAVIAFGSYTGEPEQLSMLTTVTAPAAALGVSHYELTQRLATEVSRIVSTAPLRPGYRSVGLFDNGTQDRYGDHLIDYWHDPSDTLYTLVLALPYLTSDLQQAVMTYLEAFYALYPPYLYTHVGWRDGAPRESFDLPQEAEDDLINHPAWVSHSYEGWTWPPQMFYALWKYAEASGMPGSIFDASRSRLESPPADAYLIEYPYVHNAYIAGYLGYLELEALAGYPESTEVKTELARLLALRASTFEKDTPYTGGSSRRALSIARNFMYLVPELGQYLHDTIYDEVQEAIDEYEVIAPYWFVSNFEATVGEGASQHFYDYHALFQAKALILQETGIELVKYLDVPAVQVGDLFYLQNLIAVLDARLASGLSKTSTAVIAEAGETLTYTLRFSGYEGLFTLTDTLPAGLSAPLILAPEGTSVWPTYNNAARQLMWQADLLPDEEIALRYRVTIDTAQPAALRNIAELSGPNGINTTATCLVIANAYRFFLPLVMRNR